MSSAEPREIESQNTEYLLVIKEEMDELETNFEEALATLDELIKLQTLNPDDGEESQQEFIDTVRSLQSKNNGNLQLSSAKIFQLEKKVHDIYRAAVKELHDVNYDSFSKISENFESLFDRDLKIKEARELDKALGNIAPIELDSKQVLTLDLSKEEIDKILEIEKRKRAKLSFLNESIYEPEIKSLKRQYETWGSRDNELKRFLINDISEINKKVQAVKREEGLSD